MSAQGQWTLPHPDRVTGLLAVHDLLRDRPEAIMEILTEFNTVQAAEYEIDAAVATLAGALDEVQRHRPAATGRLAVFMPSNVVLYSYVLYLLVPSLFTGALSARPASQTADHLLRIHEILGAVHGLPIEVERASQRSFLRQVVDPADVVVFTGSYQNAEQIRPQLRADQLFLFLGAGVNPFVLARGADLGQAAQDAVRIRLLNSGQDCLAPDLFCVGENDADEFLDLLKTELKAQRYGEYTDPAADYGPIFYDGALEAAALFLARHRSHIVFGGNVDFRQRRIDPAVVVRPLDGRSGETEFFAPVFNVAVYRDAASVRRILGGGIYAERALGASVYGDDPELIAELTRRHTVTVNDTLFSIDDGNAAFGGWGPMANYAAYGGRLHVAPVLISEAVANHRATGLALSSAAAVNA